MYSQGNGGLAFSPDRHIKPLSVLEVSIPGQVIPISQ